MGEPAPAPPKVLAELANFQLRSGRCVTVRIIRPEGTPGPLVEIATRREHWLPALRIRLGKRGIDQVIDALVRFRDEDWGR